MNLSDKRVKMFEDRDTFWGRNRSLLIDIHAIAEYPDDAYHPLEYVDGLLPVMCLKRKYLNNLRQRLMKIKRRKCDIGRLTRQHYQRKWDEKVQNHIAYYKRLNNYES
jgi:hypothetical protein